MKFMKKHRKLIMYFHATPRRVPLPFLPNTAHNYTIPGILMAYHGPSSSQRGLFNCLWPCHSFPKLFRAGGANWTARSTEGAVAGHFDLEEFCAATNLDRPQLTLPKMMVYSENSPIIFHIQFGKLC